MIRSSSTRRTRSTSRGSTTGTSRSGHGLHFCLGAPLARLEGQLALGTLVGRLPLMELAADEPVYKENLILRGLATLPVTF